MVFRALLKSKNYHDGYWRESSWGFCKEPFHCMSGVKVILLGLKQIELQASQQSNYRHFQDVSSFVGEKKPKITML